MTTTLRCDATARPSAFTAVAKPMTRLWNHLSTKSATSGAHWLDPLEARPDLLRDIGLLDGRDVILQRAEAQPRQLRQG